MNEVNFKKAMRSAKERFLRDCIGVGFQDGRGDWIRVRAVGTDGSVMLGDAVINEPTAVIDRAGHDDLISMIRSSAASRDEIGLVFMVSGEGERMVIDWTKVVLHSGYRVNDLLEKGIAWCLMNPRKSEEAWS